ISDCYSLELADDEMEIGMGQHGEAGTGSSKIMTADKTAETMVNQLLLAVKAESGDKIMLMINGAGATTLMEQFIVFRKAKQIAEGKGITVAHAMVGEYLTVQEMGGFQMCVAKLDDELISLLKAPSDAPFWTVR
ncbi:dihydroxyacetone kinase subunit DhaK, partial [Verrucomicrobiota bacterium]